MNNKTVVLKFIIYIVILFIKYTSKLFMLDLLY